MIERPSQHALVKQTSLLSAAECRQKGKERSKLNLIVQKNKSERE